MHPKGSTTGGIVERKQKQYTVVLTLHQPECFCIFISFFAFLFFGLALKIHLGSNLNN